MKTIHKINSYDATESFSCVLSKKSNHGCNRNITPKTKSRRLWIKRKKEFILAYFADLERKVLESHLALGADELIILSGYIAASPILKLSTKKINSKIIWGTLEEDKRAFTPRFHHINKKISSDLSNNAEVYYKQSYDHSKIYCWLKGGVPIRILAGSANFTNRGLSGSDRESLFDVDSSKYAQVHKYLSAALADSVLSTSHPGPTSSPKSITSKSAMSGSKKILDSIISNDPPSVEIYLGGEGGKMQNSGGLNWGHGKGNNDKSVGELRLRISLVRDKLPSLFPYNGINPNFGKKQSHRNSKSYAQITFDDHTVMDVSFEGHGEYTPYFKQLSSFPSRKTFGKYFRDRLGVAHNHKITDKDLKNYGRNSLTLTLVSDGEYEADFSVP